MVTNAYVPVTTVEIAWTSTYSTPYALHVWTDVTDWAELQGDDEIETQWGRENEQATVGPNELTIVLDNKDGRFTAGRTASPYYPNVKVGRPIRVRTVVGGVTYLGFYGFVDEWPTTWPGGTSAVSRVTVKAFSRLARLGLSQPLRALLDEEILLDNPLAFYPLNEAAGATIAGDASVASGVPPMRQVGRGTAAAFGTPMALATLEEPTGAMLANGAMFRVPSSIVTAAAQVEWFFTVTSVPDNDTTLASWRDKNGDGYSLIMAGNLNGATPAGNLLDPFFLTDTGVKLGGGGLHHLAVRRVGSSYDALIDGVSIGTWTTGGAATGFAAMLIGGPDAPGTDGHRGVVGRLAAFASAPTTARTLAHYTAGLTGYAGDTAAARFQRLARYAGIATEDTAAVGPTVLANFATDGITVEAALRIVEAAEGGVLWDDGYQLSLIGRAGRYTATSIVTLDMALQQVENPYTPTLDRSALVNDVTGTNVAGTYSVRETVPASVAEYGVHAASVELAAADPKEIQAAVSWQVNAYATPDVRVPALMVDLLCLTTSQQQALLGAKIGDLLTVTNHPSQAAASTASYFIEGATESIGKSSYWITFNLSPSSPYLNTWLLGDPVRGQLDAGYLIRW